MLMFYLRYIVALFHRLIGECGYAIEARDLRTVGSQADA